MCSHGRQREIPALRATNLKSILLTAVTDVKGVLSIVR
jgi:hypothetical protein